MAFEGLSEKLNNVFKKLKSRGKLTEADVKEAMREVRLALLEADVSYKVVKDFVAKVTKRAIGEDVLVSLTPAQQVIKIVNEELVALMGNDNARINISSKPPTVTPFNFPASFSARELIFPDSFILSISFSVFTIIFC